MSDGSLVEWDRWAGCRGGYCCGNVIDLDSRLLAGRYQLAWVLGRGGMAVGYAARDRRLDRRVAVKVVSLAATAPTEGQRFIREARSAAGMTHPNAVAVFDAGEADGHLYLVMEFVGGRALTDLLADRGPFKTAEAIAIITSVIAALGHTHGGIVHRDVTPSNIIVTDEGTVKLLDFGIARRLDDFAGALTATGQTVGTPTYLAPEQIEGGPLSPATDLYAASVVLFEMLTGSAPFDAETPVATALARLHAPPPAARGRGLPKSVEWRGSPEPLHAPGNPSSPTTTSSSPMNSPPESSRTGSNHERSTRRLSPARSSTHQRRRARTT